MKPYFLYLTLTLLLSCGLINIDNKHNIDFNVNNLYSIPIDSIHVSFCDKPIHTFINENSHSNIEFSINKGTDGICYEGISEIEIYRSDTSLIAYSNYFTDVYDESFRWCDVLDRSDYDGGQLI